MLCYYPRLLTRIVAPALEPLTLAEVKLFLRIDHSLEDTLISGLIMAAREAAEEFLKKSLITQSWKLALDDYAPERTVLPRGPVQSISSVKSITKAGVETLISASLYRVDAAKEQLIFDSVVLGDRVEIVYVTGYGDAAALPASVKQGLLAHIATLYDGREEGTALPPTAIALYAPHRETRL